MAVVGALALLGVSFSACKRIASALGKPEPLVDLDYQFQLEPPGRGWKLLNEQEADRLVPNAVAGLLLSGVKGQGQYAVVVIERYPGDLDAYMNLLDDTTALEGKKVEGRENLQFQGRPAIRTTMRGTFNGVKEIYQDLAFLNGGYGYQIVSWGLEGQLDAASLGAATRGFKLLDGPVRGRQRGNKVTAARGPGWEVEKGIYRSAAWGFELAPTANARLLLDAELKSIDSVAAVGIGTSQPEAYLLLLPERTIGVDARALTEKRMSQNVKTIGLEPEAGDITTTVDGEPLVLRRYRHKMQPIVCLQGALVRDDMALVVLGWSTKNARDEGSVEPITSSLAGFRYLDPEERQALAAKLAQLPDVQNAVGPDYSLRRGIYRDFASNLTWRMPPGAFELQVGPAARTTNPKTRVIIEEAGTGIGALLISQARGENDGPSYHDLATKGRYATTKGRPARTRPLELAGGVPALTTIGDTTTVDLPMVEQIVTWVDRHQAHQLILWGPRPAAEQVLARLTQLVAGLEPGAIAAMKVDGQTYTDVRLGFSYRPPELPGGPWTRVDDTPKEIARIVTAIEWKNSLYSIAIFGLCDESRQTEEGFIAKLAGKRSRLSTSKIDTDTLDGISGKRLAPDLYSPAEQIVAIRRDRTFFGLVMRGLSGSLPESAVAALKAGFHAIE